MKGYDRYVRSERKSQDICGNEWKQKGKSGTDGKRIEKKMEMQLGKRNAMKGNESQREEMKKK